MARASVSVTLCCALAPGVAAGAACDGLEQPDAASHTTSVPITATVLASVIMGFPVLGLVSHLLSARAVQSVPPTLSVSTGRSLSDCTGRLLPWKSAVKA